MLVTRALLERLTRSTRESIPAEFLSAFGDRCDLVSSFDDVVKEYAFDLLSEDSIIGLYETAKKGKSVLLIDEKTNEASFFPYTAIAKTYTNDIDFRRLKKHCKDTKQLLVVIRSSSDTASSLVGAYLCFSVVLPDKKRLKQTMDAIVNSVICA